LDFDPGAWGTSVKSINGRHRDTTESLLVNWRSISALVFSASTSIEYRMEQPNRSNESNDNGAIGDRIPPER
jgi:hypothetical protein